jgi:hypothetical protein
MIPILWYGAEISTLISSCRRRAAALRAVTSRAVSEGASFSMSPLNSKFSNTEANLSREAPRH